MSDLFCQPCGEEETQIVAFGFCLDCNEYLCQDCYKFHRKVRQTKHHRLLDGEQMLLHKPETVTLDTCMDTCSDHVGETIKYYCADHDVCGCTVCITVDHRNCPGVDHLPEVVQELADKEEWKTIETIEALVTRLGNVITASRTNIISIEEADKQVTGDIKTFRAEMNAILDQLENDSKEKAEIHRAEGLENMNMYIAKASEFMKKLKDLKLKIGQLKENKQHCRLFVVVKEMQKVEGWVQESLIEMERGNNIKTVVFHPDRELKAFTKAMHCLGVISETPKCPGDQIENSSENAETYDEEAAFQQALSPEIAGTYVQDVCVLSDTDEAYICNVNSLTALTDDRVVVSDSSNKMLKLINVKKNRIISKLSNKRSDDHYQPHATAVRKIQENRIAVTIAHRHIVIVQTKTGLIRERILINDSPDKMSFYNGCIYYCVRTNESRCVQKVDMQGRKTDVLTMKELSNSKDRHYLKSGAAYSRLASDGYVYAIGNSYNRDQSENFLAKVLSDGSIKEKIQLKKEPEALESDETETLLFVLAEDNIYTMKVGTAEAKLLLTKEDGLCKATSLAYNTATRKLYVGMGDNNFIKVYQISGI